MLRIVKFSGVLCVLFSVVMVLKAALPVIATGTWGSAGRMNSSRAGAATVLLPDGRVMIIGGNDANGNPLASTEFFNVEGSISPGPDMNTARSGHAAILLFDGEVLVTGGTTSGGGVSNS